MNTIKRPAAAPPIITLIGGGVGDDVTVVTVVDNDETVVNNGVTLSDDVLVKFSVVAFGVLVTVGEVDIMEDGVYVTTVLISFSPEPEPELDVFLVAFIV